MTRSYRAVLVALTMLAAAPAFAGDTKSNSQQDKMTACNKKAEGMKGDERKAFMSKCLSADSKSSGNSQQDKMAACNKKAAGLKGEEHQAFMSKCLSGEKK